MKPNKIQINKEKENLEKYQSAEEDVNNNNGNDTTKKKKFTVSIKNKEDPYYG